MPSTAYICINFTVLHTLQYACTVKLMLKNMLFCIQYKFPAKRHILYISIPCTLGSFFDLGPQGNNKMVISGHVLFSLPKLTLHAFCCKSSFKQQWKNMLQCCKHCIDKHPMLEEYTTKRRVERQTKTKYQKLRARAENPLVKSYSLYYTGNLTDPMGINSINLWDGYKMSGEHSNRIIRLGIQMSFCEGTYDWCFNALLFMVAFDRLFL